MVDRRETEREKEKKLQFTDTPLRFSECNGVQVSIGLSSTKFKFNLSVFSSRFGRGAGRTGNCEHQRGAACARARHLWTAAATTGARIHPIDWDGDKTASVIVSAAEALN